VDNAERGDSSGCARCRDATQSQPNDSPMGSVRMERLWSARWSESVLSGRYCTAASSAGAKGRSSRMLNLLPAGRILVAVESVD
jgi:hypothetical protein